MPRTREYRMVAAPTSHAHTLLPARLICEGEGYAMVCRRNATPFVIEMHVWNDAPVQERGKN